MNKKIKEILDKFKDYNLTTRETKILLDYITNLQQKIEDNKSDISNLTYQLAKEKEENERLLKKSYSDDVRITKAIEYIENNMKDSQLVFGINDINRLYVKNMSDLLNILQNGSDEE